MFLLRKEERLLGDTSHFCPASGLAATVLGHEGTGGAGFVGCGRNGGSASGEMGEVKNVMEDFC